MIARIRWTTEENSVVAKAAAKYFVEHPDENASRTTRLLTAMREGQKVLVPARRRNIPSAVQLRSLLPLIEDYIKALFQQKEPEETLPSAPKVEIPVAEPSIEDLIDTLAERLATRLAAKLQFQLKSRAEGILHAAASVAVETDRQEKRKVYVVGPIDSQAAMLHKEFDKLLDLRILSKEGSSIRQVKDAPVVIWTDFVSHSIQESIPRELRVYVSGGMDAVREKLEAIYCS